MDYNPEFHFNHGKPLTLEDKIYICKFYQSDGRKSLAMALGRTEKALAQYYAVFKKKGLIEYYAKKWDEQFK